MSESKASGWIEGRFCCERTAAQLTVDEAARAGQSKPSPGATSALNALKLLCCCFRSKPARLGAEDELFIEGMR